MGKYPKLISFVSFILYVLLNYYFLSFAVSYKIVGYLEEFEEIRELRKILSDNINFEEIVTNFSLFLTLISFLVQYIIAKFLLTIFSPDIKVYLYYALVPKLFITMVNIIFIGLFQIYNLLLYQFTALLGAFLIMFFLKCKKANWTASILFSSIFLLDSLYTFGKSLYSLL